MAGELYTAEVVVTGGRGEGHGRTSGELGVDLRLPKELGGEGGSTNPEELFANGPHGACARGNADVVHGEPCRRHG